MYIESKISEATTKNASRHHPDKNLSVIAVGEDLFHKLRSTLNIKRYEHGGKLASQTYMFIFSVNRPYFLYKYPNVFMYIYIRIYIYIYIYVHTYIYIYM
jgi:hypothetical protein